MGHPMVLEFFFRGKLENTRSLHSTDHRFAMICSGRDDRVGVIEIAGLLRLFSGQVPPPRQRAGQVYNLTQIFLSQNFRCLRVKNRPKLPIETFLHQNSVMDKKEINSPGLTANFLFWVCGVGGTLLVLVLAHYVWRVF